MEPSQSDDGYVVVVDLEVDEVQPGRTGFVLLGQGEDRADYRLEMHLDIPVDRRTQAVLGELLSQSEWRVLRRAPTPLRRDRPRQSRDRISH